MTDRSADPALSNSRYRVIGMDCARDAAAVEAAVRDVQGVAEAKVSAATHVLSFSERGPLDQSALFRVVADLGYTLEPSSAGGESTPSQAAAPAYRRALLIVMVLNVGYGIVEMAGGFISESQALKADALDFLGDGLITFLGVLAIGWSVVWRAKAALLQGIFLGLMGAGVLASTAYRVLAQQQPEAELMGLLGLIALAVNLGSAALLLPHRSGDANVRAVWLFSRNDAIGNLAVVLAASLVALTHSAWPDLLVAIAIAGLFLHSAWAIVRDAREELF